MVKSHWVERPLDRDKYYTFLKEGGLTPFLASFLARRDFSDLSSTYKFLFPRLEDFADPYSIPDMDLAVKRLERALLSGETIGIYADSDADGILGAFLLEDFLSHLHNEEPLNKERVIVYFGDRLGKGYGFHPESISYFKEKGVSLIITVDVGISNSETVDLAKASNIEVIVTDHHEFQALPRTITITGKRSTREDLYHLCGAGVVFQLVKALRTYLYSRGFFAGRPIPKLRPYLEIAGLATLADMVPIVGENRLITYFGFRDLAESFFPSLSLLFDGLKYGLTERDLYLSVISRINACFRLGRPELFFRFLKERDLGQAEKFLKEIDSLNEERKGLSASIWERVLLRLPEAEQESFVLLVDETIPKGYLGLIAQRIKAYTRKPVIVLRSEPEGILFGSARSPEGLEFLSLLLERKDLFLHIGGHQYAFGLKIEKSRLPELAAYLERSLRGFMPEVFDLIYLDYEGRLAEFFDEENLLALKGLPPFGQRHEPPMVLLKRFEIREIKLLKEKHTQLRLGDGQREARAILFNQLLEREPVLIVAQPYINSYKDELEFRIEDLRDELE